MFKFNLTLLTIITFSYGITHPPRTTLQWNPNIFGNLKTVKKVSPHKNKIKLNQNIHCGIKKQIRLFSLENSIKSMIHHLYSLNEMRVKGLITNKEYKRAKGNTMKKWKSCSIRKSNQIGNVLQLLTTVHETDGLNEREFVRLKISFLR